MQKETKDKHFIKKPIYPGGLKAMRKFISKEMKYPKPALAKKIEGTVYIKYEINHKGKVVKTKVLSSLGYGCDEEAQRLVSSFQFLMPKNPRKLRLTFHKTIRIRFKLPVVKKTNLKQKKITVPKPATVQKLSYTITPSKKKEKQPEKKSAYSYTIKF